MVPKSEGVFLGRRVLLETCRLGEAATGERGRRAALAGAKIPSTLISQLGFQRRPHP
jgi:hypothetical protein